MPLEINKIVITGGPCAGKTTALSRIEDELTDRGYKVIVVPETATTIIKSGITPIDLSTLEFQKTIFDMQVSHEEIWDNAIEKLKDEKIVVVYDRGVMDNKAYMDKQTFSDILKERGTNEVSLMNYYDAVIHLKTAADGALKFYTLSNNEARSETPEEAIKLDKKTLEAWTGHPHLRVIDNSTDFEGKMDRLMNEMYNILGIPVPIEIERKFLISMPNLEYINSVTKCVKSEIIQTYLCGNENEEKRIRQRGVNGNYVYYYTVKTKITDLKRVEKEKKISKDEYLSLLMEADTKLKQIRKTRYCFMLNNQYFELDVYPFWEDKAIMEVELTNENEEINMPDFIHVIKDVTSDDNYKNHSIAQGKLNIC